MTRAGWKYTLERVAELPIKIIDDEYAFRCARHFEGEVEVQVTRPPVSIGLISIKPSSARSRHAESWGYSTTPSSPACKGPYINLIWLVQFQGSMGILQHTL